MSTPNSAHSPTENPQAQRSPPGRPVLVPRVDIYESDGDVLVTADLPGVPEGQVRLHLERDQLLLEATTQLPAAVGEPVGQEFGNVDYRRVFLVPKDIDSEGITAELQDGVLRVRLPKLQAARPRRIEVLAS
ncbi:MAG: Hsp20/alpha crystallin family protein [Myxococcota bacterium]